MHWRSASAYISGARTDTTHLLKGAKHGTRNIFYQFDCEGYQGFEGLLRETWFQGLLRRDLAKLADPEERSVRDRSFSRDVREEYVNVQPWLGQQCPEVEYFHRCARTSAPVEGARRGVNGRGGRELDWPGKFHGVGSRRQPNSR